MGEFVKENIGLIITVVIPFIAGGHYRNTRNSEKISDLFKEHATLRSELKYIKEDRLIEMEKDHAKAIEEVKKEFKGDIKEHQKETSEAFSKVFEKIDVIPEIKASLNVVEKTINTLLSHIETHITRNKNN